MKTWASILIGLGLFGLFGQQTLLQPPCLASPALSFTVIPPGPVTDKIRVELRLAVPNGTSTAREFVADFYWDKADTRHLISHQTVTAPPNGFALARAWWETAGQAGKHALLYRVRDGQGILAGRWPLEVVASTTRALPLLQGGWLDPLAFSGGTYASAHDAIEQDVRTDVQAMKRLGMSTIIVTYVEYFGSFFYPSKITFYDRDVHKLTQGQRFHFDVVETVLSEADKLGMHVFLGLGRGGDTPLLWTFDKPDWQARNAAMLKTSRQVATELWERYHHHPSFYGWYLTHEMDDLARASAYYNPTADVCHSFSPDKPVLVAPAGTPVMTKEILERSHVDIFAYQDAVGSGYVPYKNTFNPENRIAMLPTVYEQYRQWHEGTTKHIWSDLEIWEMDGTKGYSGGYSPSFDRVKRQIDIEAKYAEMLTAYELHGFMEPPDRSTRLRDPRAARLYEAYVTYIQRSGRAPRKSD